MALLPATTRAAAAAGLCRIAASASSTPPSPSSAPARRGRELPLPLALLAERGKMMVGGHRGMGMNAVGAPPGARVGAARERENTLLSFGRAAAHAAVAFVEFDVQVRARSWRGVGWLVWSLFSFVLQLSIAML
jgi:glycerophosphodiester phosphodiesterase